MTPKCRQGTLANMGQNILEHVLAAPATQWLCDHLGEGAGVVDAQGVLLAGTMSNGSVAEIRLAGRIIGTAHGPEAKALAAILAAMARSHSPEVDGEEEFREIILALASELKLAPLLHKIMDAATRILDADRSTLFLNDRETSELWSPVAQGMHGQEIRFPNHLGIAGSVFTQQESINIADAYADERFNKDLDRTTGYVTTTILCCPVRNKQGEAIGAIEALNKTGGSFTAQDARRLTAFAAQASMAIENAQLYANLEEKVRERTRDLNNTLDTLSNELDRAAEYVKRLIPEPLQQDELSVDWRFIPSVALGGDAFGYHWLDHDHFAIYLTDVSGHGVGAALLSVSITNVLRVHALPGVDFRAPTQVLQTLNATFPMEEHNNMFFTMWYGVYCRTTRTLVYASGGHPPALLLSGGRPPDCLRTPNPLVGGISGATYAAATVCVEPGDRLVVFSDGCYEITKKDGELWTLGAFS
ncbi:MAG: SpoIIE family protein phosphatase, partial [Proteobacteria bacterium]|nr:SpoIIE family protein phosphatase [Pseudomonadota bacterium]